MNIKTSIFMVIAAVTFFSAPSYSFENEFKNGQRWPGSQESTYSGAANHTSDGTDLVLLANASRINAFRMKFEEGNLSDALTTEKLKTKALKLAKLVKQEWGDSNVYLRITEAYDTDNEHSNFSLHYEGRALDITTTDKSEKKLGRLASLAVEAGFDWVYYENNHIHVSVKK